MKNGADDDDDEWWWWRMVNGDEWWMVMNGEWCFWWCMKVLNSRWLNGLDGPRLLDHHLEGRVRWLELGPCTGFQRSVSFTNGGFLRRSSSPIPFRREKTEEHRKTLQKHRKKHVCKIYLERCFNEEGQLDPCLMSLKRESWEILTVITVGRPLFVMYLFLVHMSKRWKVDLPQWEFVLIWSPGDHGKGWKPGSGAVQVIQDFGCDQGAEGAWGWIPNSRSCGK